MRGALRNLPIRRKITGLVILTTISTLLLAFVTMMFLSYRFEGEEVVADLDTLAHIVAANSAGAVLFKDAETARATLAGLRGNPSIIGAAIYTPDGRPFVTYGIAGKQTLAETRLGSSRADTVTSYKAIELDGDMLGTLCLVSDLRDLDDALTLQLTAGFAVLTLSIMVALLMTAGLQRLVTRPLISLAAVAQQVTREKDYGVRVSVAEVREGDELHRVVQAFNEMLVEIEARDETLRRHQIDLERQVDTRTAELRTANRELQGAMDLARSAADESASLSRHNDMILNGAAEGIFGLDANGILTFMNPSAARILACDEKVLTGTNLHALIHCADGEETSRSVADCPICGANLAVPVRGGRDAAFRACNGARVPVDYTSSTIIDEHGHASGVVVTFRDITDRLAVERMKDEFVSTVSHELRTPLTSIRGALGLLTSGFIGTPTPKGRRMLDIALANTDRLGRLINDILDLEKMTAGGLELNRQILSTRTILEEAVEQILPMADRARVQIISAIEEGHVDADGDRVTQTVSNLLSNAIKFSPPDTVITIAGAVHGNEYVISVRDHGRGIPVDKLEMIFQRFKQVDASDSRDKGGTGLGLAICRAIAEAHGGRIWAERPEGGGALFTFTLPLPYTDLASSREDQRIHGIPSSARVGRGASQPSERVDVLLVEDDRDLSRVVIAALEDQGVRVAHAASGGDALNALERMLPSLIILDLVLPGLDGFAVVDWIRRNTTLQNVPLVVYTAEEVRAAEQERLLLGPTQFITKSRVSLEEFQARVIRLLNTVAKGVAGAA